MPYRSHSYPTYERVRFNVENFFPGQEPSRNDRIERPRRGVPVRRSGLAVDRSKEFSYASAGVKFPLPRAQARGDRRRRGLYPPRVEDVTEFTEDFGAQRTFLVP